MAQRVSVLVIANATAASPQLIDALRQRAERGPIRVTLLMPSVGPGLNGRDAAQSTLDDVLEQWREEGLEEVDGLVGDQDPMVAVHETWDPQRFDEVIVSTLPSNVSEWVRWDLAHRVARATDAQVSHVVSSMPPVPPRTEPAPRRERPRLGPLSVLAWGHPRDETEDERERRLRALRH
jgi:hypothetical protein